MTRALSLAAVVLTAARVALGALWINEGLIKYRAGFGAADIQLVADGAAGNSRVPGYFEVFAEYVLGPASGLFGVLMPLLEVGLGVALVAGVLTLPVALASVGTLLSYWSADQLTWSYPVMVALAVVLVAWPRVASRFSVTALVRRLNPASAAPR
ncbi:DoxX family membrane protein [Promicromonospora sukumoe]|uniref:DoxX family membrane protein n=1 Tax=Promicromonospora sukumoe TaxID=88382 RepID=UPI000368D90B|nr:DoxX family membrane protein [Promicromonospora sukumoe]